MTDKSVLRGAGVAAVFGRQAAAGPVGQQVGDPTSLHSVMQTRQQPEGDKKKSVKATYYLDPELIKPLKFLSVERGKDLSALVNEAVRDLLAKYKS